MTLMVCAASLFLLAFAIPYHAPRLGLVAGLVGLAFATLMMLHGPTSIETGRSTGPVVAFGLDFDMTRPLGIALGLYALLWLAIASAQLFRHHSTHIA